VKTDELLPAPRNFTLTLAERVRAQGGVPAHIARKKRIEDLIDAALAELRALPPETMRARARALDLRRVNELIVKHNRYYPIEANLPIDPATGGSQAWQPLAAVTADWLLARL
jgi:hypothetical protein